jgi:four helix bundle protein
MTPHELKARTAAFSRRIVVFCCPLLERLKTIDTARQLLRAGTAVDANYNSAQNGRSHAEFTAKLGQVLDDASESRNWLGVMRDTGLVPDDALVRDLWREADELTRIFAKAYATARASQAERRRKKHQRPDDPMDR